MTAPVQRYFFAHVQKTAGTSIVELFVRRFGSAAVYPDASDDLDTPGRNVLVHHLLDRYRLRRTDIRVVTGHFPLATVELLEDRFTTLTMLRDPVERTLSYLRHHRQMTPADRDKTLEEIYEDPFRFHGLIHNHMVKMFSLTPEEMVAGDGILTRVEFGAERLAAAQDALATVDLVGLQEDFDTFREALGRLLGSDLGHAVHANRTGQLEVPRSFRARIAADNALDVELYDFARGLCESRRAQRETRM